MRNLTRASLMLCSALLLAACEPENDEDDFDGTPIDTGVLPAPFGPLFDPANSIIPFPSNLLFSGTLDGTLNIPVADPADLSDPQVALNTLDGFSTIAPMSVAFSDALDPATVGAATVRVFEATLDPLSKAVASVDAELTYGSDFFASVASTDPDGETLAIVPLRPLKSAQGYVVVLTRGIQSMGGDASVPDTTYGLARLTSPPPLPPEQATSLEPLRQLINAQDAALSLFEAGLDDMAALAWSFNTQTIGAVLSTVLATVAAADPPASSVLADFGADSPGSAADLYVGTVDLPYYLTAAADTLDPTPLLASWQAANEVGGERNLTGLNPLPMATGTVTAPLLVSIPMGAPADWPTVIFQHGLTRNRGVMVGIADALAAAGFAVVSMDLPLHGITGNETDGTAPFRMEGMERTFDLDLVTQDPVTGAITAQATDGVIDTSGRHATNLANLANFRDNLRQAAVDVFSLTRALETMTTADGDTFDTDNLHLVGFSTGGFGSSVAMALDDSIQDAVLGMTGGGLAKSFDASPGFAPELSASLLAVAGLEKGTADYERFIGAMQTMLDSGDPLNYAAATTAGRNVMVIEVVGDGTNLPDQTLINNVFPAPLAGTPTNTVASPTAGTDPWAALMGQNVVNASGAETAPWLRFTAGHHGSLLTPDDADGNADATSAAVFAAAQQATSTFLANDGTSFTLPGGAGALLEAP